jgi:hypothetical protein
VPELDLSDLPNPDDRRVAWSHDIPAFLAWWRRGESHGEGLRLLLDHRLFERYAHSVPTNEALQVLTELGPLLEIGAGAGYWARLLRDLGGDVIATDPVAPSDNAWFRGAEPWTPIQQAGVEAVRRYPDRAIFLCWPPRPRGFMRQLLASAPGRIVALITDALPSLYDDLHDRLSAGWTCREAIALPTVAVRGDRLTVWTPR